MGIRKTHIFRPRLFSAVFCAVFFVFCAVFFVFCDVFFVFCARHFPDAVELSVSP